LSRSSVGLGESHLRGGAGDLAVEVGLHHGLLLLLQGLFDQGAGDQHLDHVAAVAIEAHRLHVLDQHRLTVDEGGHAGPGGRLRGIVHHVLDAGRILELFEDLARCLAALPLPQFLGEVRTNLVELRPRWWQMPLALDHDELIGHLDDLGDAAFLKGERGLVECRIAGVEADRLHPAIRAGATDVDGMLAGEGSELFGSGEGLLPHGIGVLPTTAGDDPRLHGGAEPILEGLLKFLGRRLDRAAGDAAEGEHRPDDVVGVLLGRDPSLLLDHLQPLVAGHAEAACHRVDLGAHVLRRDRDPLLLAGLFDDASIDERLQNTAPMATEAFRRQLVGGDLDAVDDGDRLAARVRRRRGLGWRGVRFEAAGHHSPADPHTDDHRRRRDLARNDPPRRVETHDCPPWMPHPTGSFRPRHCGDRQSAGDDQAEHQSPRVDGRTGVA
jgi:hypothetical protein